MVRDCLPPIAREIGDRYGEGSVLGTLGDCYDSLGDYPRAIEHHEQSLAIAREIGHRYVESCVLVYLGNTYIQLGRLAPARAQYQAAIRIADETGNKQNQHEAYYGLAFANLLTEELPAALDEIQTAQKHDYPSNNAAMWTLTGIIQLRLKERTRACEAFSRGLAEANELLEKSKQNVSALDTKALALCGLAICEDIRHREEAAETFQEARQITRAKGVVAHVLKQFDALAKADTDGILEPLRKAVKGEK